MLPNELARVSCYLRDPAEYPPNESCTCEWVVVPLLWQCGYAHSDIVSRTLDVAGKFPDYTVLPKTAHTWYLEAKAWSEPLKDDHVIQAMNYAHTTGHRWVVLTNGREWRLYDDHIQGVEARHRLVATAHLESEAAILRLLQALGKPSVIDGGLERFALQSRLRSVLDVQLTQPDSEIVRALTKTLNQKLGLNGIQPAEVVAYFQHLAPASPPAIPQATHVVPVMPVAVAPSVTTPVPTPAALTLQECRQAGNGIQFRKPTQITLPNGTQKAISTWRDVASEVVIWLGERDQLPSLPYQSSARSKRYFLNSSPTHIHSVMTARKIELPNQTVYLHTNRSGPDLVYHAVALCEYAGQSASSFVVAFAA